MSTTLFGIGSQLPLFVYPKSLVPVIKREWASVDAQDKCVLGCNHRCGDPGNSSWECAGDPHMCNHRCTNWTDLLEGKLDEVDDDFADSVRVFGIVNPVCFQLGYSRPDHGLIETVRVGNGHHRLAIAIDLDVALPVVFASQDESYMMSEITEREKLVSANDGYQGGPVPSYARGWNHGLEVHDYGYHDDDYDEDNEHWCEVHGTYCPYDADCEEDEVDDEVFDTPVPDPASLWHAQQP
jgi:hypothetical protein